MGDPVPCVEEQSSSRGAWELWARMDVSRWVQGIPAWDFLLDEYGCFDPTEAQEPILREVVTEVLAAQQGFLPKQEFLEALERRRDELAREARPKDRAVPLQIMGRRLWR